jgi:hypothetical protein
MRVQPTGEAGPSVALIEQDYWVAEYEPARLEFLVSEQMNPALQSQKRRESLY